MRVKVPAADLICLLATACAGVPETPPPARAEIGVHVVSFRVPEGWDHLDHGLEHRFQRELSQISASDLGPVVSEGYSRELRHAYQLFRDYRPDDARAHVSDLDLRPAFPDLAALVENLFPFIETAAHREIAERNPVELDGRQAIRVETWDRLSHDHRQSFLFVLNEGNLFVLRMEMGKYAEMKPAFETLAGSLEFHSASTTS